MVGDASMFPQVLFNDLSPEEAERWAKEVSHTSAALFAAPSGYEPWANGIPCGYIFCEDDNALPLSYQQGMTEQLQLGPDSKTVSLKADHCPFVSRYEEVLSALRSMI